MMVRSFTPQHAIAVQNLASGAPTSKIYFIIASQRDVAAKRLIVSAAITAPLM
jgi:hypothetical protein